MADAKRDNNAVTTLIAVSNADGVTPVVLYADPTTHRLLVSSVASIAIGTTVTSGTAGSVLYVDAAGKLAQDNSNFYWDGTNHRLGIGTTSPGFSLDVEKSDVHFGIGAAGTTNAVVGGVGVEIVGTNNTVGGMNLILNNKSSGTSAFTDLFLQNDLADATGTHFAVVNLNSSTYSDTTFGTAIAIPNQLSIYGTDGPMMVGTAKSGSYINFIVGGTATTNENMRLTATSLRVGLPGTTKGQLDLSGNTSGTTSIVPAAAASGTLTLPAATDTVAVLAASQAFTNKTYNSLSITNNAGGTLSIGASATLAVTGSVTVTIAGAGTAVYTMPGATTTLVGTDSSQTLTNKTISFGSNTFSMTSAQLATAVTDETGSGALVFGTTPTFTTSITTPKIIGGSGTTGTQLTLQTTTGNGTTDALVIAGGNNGGTTFATFSSNALSLGTSAVLTTGTIELGNASDTTLSRSGAGQLAVEGVDVITTSNTKTMTNKTLTSPAITAPTITGVGTADIIKPNNNAVTVASNAGTCSSSFELNTFTNSSAAAMTVTVSTSSAVDGQKMIVRIYDFSAVAQTISWVNTENSTVSVPTTSNGSTTLPLTVGFMYNGSTSKWRCVASA